MDDKDERGSRFSPLGARVRSALGGVRQHGSASLRGVRRSVAEATDRLKSTEVAERLGAAVETRRVIKKAADAQRRGNHAMAYRLLEPEVQESPDDARLIAAFWSAARACERAEEAVPAMVHVIRRLAGTGKPEQAAELWVELREAAPTALVDPGSLVRIATVLQADGRPDRAVHALREAVDPENSGLSPGLAVRVAELAVALDPPTALSAAGRALASPDLHVAKRGRLESLVAELRKTGRRAAPEAPAAERSAAPGSGPAAVPPEPEPPAAGGSPAHSEATDAAVDDALEALAPSARFGDVKVTEAMPTALQEEGLALQLLAGRRARVEYSRIGAVAVAEVAGLAAHPVLLIDLVLNWSAEGDQALRVVRLRSDGFDPRMLMEAPADPLEALRAFLAELLQRCNAVPLPDPDGALGVRVPAFDRVEAYQRAVLQAAS